MSFTLFLNSINGTKPTAGADNTTLLYNFDFSTVPPHPQGPSGKYKLHVGFLSEAVVGPTVGYITADFSCQKFMYDPNSTNGAIPSNYIGSISPLYAVNNIVTQNLDVPIYLMKPSNNNFTISLKLISGASMAQFTNAINYMLTISFIAVVETDGLPYIRDHLIEYKN